MIEEQKNRFQEVLKKTEEIVEGHQKNVQALKELLAYMEGDIAVKENDSVHTVILKKYMELGAIKKVQEFINESGYRIKTKAGERKYTATDISKVIFPYKENEDDEEPVIDADEELQSAVKFMHVYISSMGYGKLRVREVTLSK